MIVAFTDVGDECSILIKTDDEQEYTVEYRVDNEPITCELFTNYDRAEKCYQEWASSIVGESNNE